MSRLHIFFSFNTKEGLTGQGLHVEAEGVLVSVDGAKAKEMSGTELRRLVGDAHRNELPIKLEFDVRSMKVSV